MKLWEAMKALDGNPNKVFESGNRIIRNDDGKIVVQKQDGARFLFSYQYADDDWLEIKRPVTWQEAIQAWADGKTIRLAMLGWEQVWGPTNAVELNQSRIKDGTWYVED